MFSFRRQSQWQIHTGAGCPPQEAPRSPMIGRAQLQAGRSFLRTSLRQKVSFTANLYDEATIDKRRKRRWDGLVKSFPAQQKQTRALFACPTRQISSDRVVSFVVDQSISWNSDNRKHMIVANIKALFLWPTTTGQRLVFFLLFASVVVSHFFHRFVYLSRTKVAHYGARYQRHQSVQLFERKRYRRDS